MRYSTIIGVLEELKDKKVALNTSRIIDYLLSPENVQVQRVIGKTLLISCFPFLSRSDVRDVIQDHTNAMEQQIRKN